eukprot:CAMPEP_0205804656 /NCGR_PEP_ID=MMETSP0205-20121125/7641_1 /ASSEMBLY_ACC=CAM_ASM_000278 /TAXON_ID=36767 /ORGANISM="Euplotes focardii, Strain TN1" /LENGTH=146 /DNA_ID=CAMNT_0053074615 /DNA_START=305 /DNA_END=745 /DNA_ORIENTATION=+
MNSENSKEGENQKYILMTNKEYNHEKFLCSEDGILEPLDEKVTNKKFQQEGKKKYKLEGNLNHVLNPVELPEIFEFSRREIKNLIVRGAGRKNALYNGKTTEPKNNHRAKYSTRTRKKRILDNNAMQDLGKVPEYSDKKLHRAFFD